MITYDIIKKISYFEWKLNSDYYGQVNYNVLREWNANHPENKVEWFIYHIDENQIDSIKADFGISQKEILIFIYEKEYAVSDKALYRKTNGKIMVYPFFFFESCSSFGDLWFFNIDYISIGENTKWKKNVYSLVDCLCHNENSFNNFISDFGKEKSLCILNALYETEKCSSSCFYLAEYYFFTDRNIDRSEAFINEGFNYLSKDITTLKSQMLYLKSRILWERKELNNARNIAIKLQGNIPGDAVDENGESLNIKVIDLLAKYDKEFVGNLSDWSSEHCRLILPVDEYKTDVDTDYITQLKLHDLPKELFPANSLSKNKVFLYNHNIGQYVEYANDYKNKLMESKLNEFMYFVQCLGAERVYIATSRSVMEESLNREKGNANAHMRGFGFSATGNLVSDSMNEMKNEETQSIKFMQTFTPPKNAPLDPETLNLKWYKTEEQWHTYYQQRLLGQTVMDTEISLSSFSSFNSEETTKIGAELKLFGFKSGFDVQTQSEEQRKKEEHYRLYIHVEFSEIKENESIAIDVMDSEENITGYIKWYKLYCKSGIEDTNMLSDLQHKYMISDKKAAEIRLILEA